MHSHVHVHRAARARGFGQAIRLLPHHPAPLRVHREPEILVETSFGHQVHWHLSGGPWPASPSAAIGPLKGFHHGMLAPGATWPTHIHEDMRAITYVVTGALAYSDSVGNHGVVGAGGVQERWLGWGTEHREWNPSETEQAEFIQLWFAIPRADPTFSERPCQIESEDRSGRWLEVAQSECWPSDGPMLDQNARVHVARVDPSSGPTRYGFDAGHGGYMYVIEGDVEANLERLQTGDAARVVGAGQLHVHAFRSTELMLVDVPL